ncbi:hypothetical protein F7R91_14320 [Streptomyces luteolifulvus]|uniref:Uncharacterized protein n=1 Tax=Streptomyces luteolifulvus TaxID=2615112 RepID=A0A6H9V4G4_9ACTN|nr:hypothetical protein [Streptomyces luteolifulvus]KAB1146752.1 hypothetical protein F7R91_14320 [Streptomyces luteolifulvus]
MKQPRTPTPPPSENPLLLTKAELMDWLKVSRMWVAMRLADDPEFVRRCVVDIATPGSSRQTLRFPAAAVADYLGIPAEATPKPIAA